MPDAPAIADLCPDLPLAPDEVVLALFKPAARGIFLAAAPWIGIVVCCAILVGRMAEGLTDLDLVLACLALSAAILCGHLMAWMPRQYVVTSRRVMVLGGVRRQRIEGELPLRRIRRMFLHRHLNQQAVGLADLWLESDQERLRCADLADARRMMEAVTDAVQRYGGPR